ncbi:alternative ribosome rescue aminoacyl-tRNA hydrolase ArfB [Echinicola shivajiensis]|uniref:alternative ribosome rescue aminoacyl-tRNA hydrolase ArfB n=1 Tax=Echinicola shivajiensis TaxID=1035916 RepID=UPI001FE334DC|nr:alternative ribosome rescue aminoacyl-tRNA hydrolase ArfB [Echinicola shivajiensis]
MRSAAEISVIDFSSEASIKAVKSGGPGGQNVNKVNTKVVLVFDIESSQLFDEEEKDKLRKGLSESLNADGTLQITVQESRSQLQNKTIALKKLQKVLSGVFVRKKVRKATKPGKAAVKRRLESKKKQAEKKQWRKKLY